MTGVFLFEVKTKFTKNITLGYLRFLVIFYNCYYITLNRAIMELPTYKKKLLTFDGLVAKIDLFSIFWKVISRKPLDLHC